MRRLYWKLRYKFLLFVVRHWADPAITDLAEKYGAVIVTASRHGTIVLPTYHALPDGEIVGRLTRRVHDLERSLRVYEQ